MYLRHKLHRFARYQKQTSIEKKYTALLLLCLNDNSINNLPVNTINQPIRIVSHFHYNLIGLDQ